MIVIDGPAALDGELKVQGAKNSTLPLLAATVLVSVALFSLIFYHWCLHAKQTGGPHPGGRPPVGL